VSYSLQSCDTSIYSVLSELSVSFSTLVGPSNREDACSLPSMHITISCASTIDICYSLLLFS
jgi:hypothetical protein